MNSPYKNLPQSAFWKTGVAERPTLSYPEFYKPKFKIQNRFKFVTSGSCFAQHVGRTLKEKGLNVVDAETVPNDVPDSVAHAYGYRLFSARYGNVYTTRQLLQLYKEALGKYSVVEPVWEKDGKFYDSQRPNIEPGGFGSKQEVLVAREEHLQRVLFAFKRAQIFVFTLGLTEAWVHKDSGTVYPTAPGTIAGNFDPNVYEFMNFRHSDVLNDFLAFRTLLKKASPKARFILTVSPVPLTATASGHHVEVATQYSKAVLRSVCGELQEQYDDVDYFPSYEIITSQTARGMFYENNLRNVAMHGVQTAMHTFVAAHGLEAAPPTGTGKQAESPPNRKTGENKAAEEVCEEALLEAFAK